MADLYRAWQLYNITLALADTETSQNIWLLCLDRLFPVIVNQKITDEDWPTFHNVHVFCNWIHADRIKYSAL